MHLRRTAIVLWLLALAIMLGLHFVHLRADFPNHSQWNDAAKYTDEGWYANAAIRHQLSGSWYLPGDFNPAIALPVWPVLAALLFSVTGLSLTALRALTVAIFFCDLALIYLLLRVSERRTVALLGVTLGATSAFLSAFSRLAILEPLVTGCFLLALLLAHHVAATRTVRRRWMLAIALGAVLCLLILVKATSLCLLPAIAWMLWYPQRLAVRRFCTSAAITLSTGLALWGLYYFQFVRPHYTADYRYLFTANQWPQPAGLSGWLADVWFTLHGLLWIGRILPIVAIGISALSVLPLRSFLPLRSLWRNPLYPASLLAIAGMLFFVVWHNNPQPRYYTVIVPACICIATLGAGKFLEAQRWRLANRLAVGLLGIACCSGAWHIAQTIAHPQYTYLHAAQALTRYIDQHPQGNRLLLSVSGDQISLMTGLPAICDDYGTAPLRARLARYRPGWYATWNQVDPGNLEDIHTGYRLVRVASFPALDDPDRNQLILYRMLPLPGPDVGVDVDDEP